MAKIIVTDEMREVGRTVLREFRDRLSYPDWLVVEKVYEAMRAAEPKPVLVFTAATRG